MSLINPNEAAGTSAFYTGRRCFNYETPTVTKRDSNGIPIDPEYESSIVEYHYMDQKRRPLTKGRSIHNGPARPICPSYRPNGYDD